MRRLSNYRLLALWLIVAGVATARAENDADLVIAPDDLVYCTTCHGVQLMGNREVEAPRLSAMSEWYVAQQLVAFKNGWRGAHAEDLIGMEMRPMAEALSDKQIDKAAAFVSATRSPAPAVTVDGDAETGRNHYTSCIACHGREARGNQSLGAPALTGLNDWYLVRQLDNYRRGIRGSDPADTYGMQMRAATQLLEDEQAIRDVVRYITTLD